MFTGYFILSQETIFPIVGKCSVFLVVDRTAVSFHLISVVDDPTVATGEDYYL